MKRLRVENGKLYCYIEEQDVQTLSICKKFVRPSVFEEESIKRGVPDCNGLFKIVDLPTVQYVKGLPYIPNADFYANMADDELGQITERAISDTEGMVLFLDDYCEMLTTPTEEQKQGIRQMTQLDQAMVETLLRSNIEDPAAWENVCAIAKCLKRQSENFLYPVLDVLYAKQEQANTKSDAGYGKVLSRTAVRDTRK